MAQDIATTVKEYIITISQDSGNFFSRVTRYRTHAGVQAVWSMGNQEAFRLRLDMKTIRCAAQPQQKIPVEFDPGWMMKDNTMREHLLNHSFTHQGRSNGQVKQPGFLAITVPYHPGERQLPHPPRWCADKGEVLDFLHGDEMRPEPSPRLVVVLGLRAPLHIYRLSLCRNRRVKHIYLYEKALRW